MTYFFHLIAAAALKGRKCFYTHRCQILFFKRYFTIQSRKNEAKIKEFFGTEMIVPD